MKRIILAILLLPAAHNSAFSADTAQMRVVPNTVVNDPFFAAPVAPPAPAKKPFTIIAEQSREECWLDNMSSVNNDVVARQILKDCSKYDPYPYAKSEGWFGGKTVSWCIRKYGKDTVSTIGSRAIAAACNKLYKNE